jgi:hypothetical protein
MTTLKKYCEENGLDINKVFDLVLGAGGGILPQKGCFTGYFTEITDTSIICTNDKLGVKKEIPFSSFSAAEFGIGSGHLWLQCVVDGNPFVFCTLRKNWKSPSAKLLLEKISAQTEIQGMKEYERYMGKLFFLWVFLR